MIGTSARPLSVSAYSTRGGTSGNVWRSTMPSSSSARRRSERVRGEMPWSERSSSQKRDRPSARSRITSSVHLPQTMSAVRHTGQSEFGTGHILPQHFTYESGRLGSVPGMPELPDVLVCGVGGTLGEAWMRGVLNGLADGAGLDFRRCEHFVGSSAGSIVTAVLAAGERPDAGARAAAAWGEAARDAP